MDPMRALAILEFLTARGLESDQGPTILANQVKRIAMVMMMMVMTMMVMMVMVMMTMMMLMKAMMISERGLGTHI